MDVHADLQLAGQCHRAVAGSCGTMTRLLADTAAAGVPAAAAEAAASARTCSSRLESWTTATIRRGREGEERKQMLQLLLEYTVYK